jgi:hypothetical protein
MWGGSGALGGELIIAVLLLFVTAVLVVLGHAALVVPGRENPNLCVRRFTHWLGCAGFLCGGLSGMFADSWPIVSRAGMGLVLGAAAGFLVGVVVRVSLGAVNKEVGS